MASAGAASVITQVQQGGPPVVPLGDVRPDETISMDLRGMVFVLSREELLTLPEFVLLSLFPNGLFPENTYNSDGESISIPVDYDPQSLDFMLTFFRNTTNSLTQTSTSELEKHLLAPESVGRDDSLKRIGIIVLREDLDFYVIPPRSETSSTELLRIKRSAAKSLVDQNSIFSGLKRSDTPGTTEAHLIEMLTAGGFNYNDSWGHRASEPNKAVICSIALTLLRTDDIHDNDFDTNSVSMAQKLLLFWRKPARRCWWEGVDLEGVDGVEGKLKVWIRRVWTLEMSIIGA